MVPPGEIWFFALFPPVKYGSLLYCKMLSVEKVGKLLRNSYFLEAIHFQFSISFACSHCTHVNGHDVTDCTIYKIHIL